jgi:hypothetical protein
MHAHVSGLALGKVPSAALKPCFERLIHVTCDGLLTMDLNLLLILRTYNTMLYSTKYINFARDDMWME